MAKIDRAKELVENHSTEEVLEWIEIALKNGVRAINNVEDSANDSFILGQCSINLKELLGVVSALREKLSPKGPVVA